MRYDHLEDNHPIFGPRRRKGDKMGCFVALPTLPITLLHVALKALVRHIRKVRPI